MLHRVQMKPDDDFNFSEYSKTMLSLFEECYILPNHPTHKRLDANENEKKKTDYPYDELFIWSLTLYSGHQEDLNLIKLYWSKSKFPIACALVAKIIFKNFCKQSFIPDHLKELIQEINPYLF